MSQQSILFGAGGAVVGLIAGILFSGGPGEEDISSAVSEALAPGQEAAEQTASAQQEAIAALNKRIAALEASMPEAGAVTEQIHAAMDEKLSGLTGELSAAISNATDQQKAAFDSAMAEITSGLEQSAQAAAAAVASTAGPSGDGDITEADGVAVSDPLKPGQTAMFADGKIRAFVSRLDPSGGSVRMVINQEPVSLGAGGSTPVSFDGMNCSIVVLGMTDDGAKIGSDCDSAQPAESSGQADAGASDGGVPPAPEDGFRPGTVAQLADGALRVFVSGLSADGSAARIAVNGVTTQLVSAGESVEVTSGDQSCNLTVTGVGNGMVGLEGSCG